MNREDILAAAAQVISQKGYHAASMADIAEAVNLRKPSLYHHINSKQEILFDLLEQALDLLTAEIETIVESNSPADEKLGFAVQKYLGILTDKREIASVLLLEHRSLSPELWERHVIKRDRFELLWRSIIREGVRDGIFNCDDPSLAARAILGLMNWTIMWYRPDGKLTAKEIANQYVGLITRGLLRRENNT